jgi:RNA polymerase sigma-70 factor (ECF subfamily)
VLVSDGGAHKRAARHPIKGRDRLARFMANLGRRYTADATIEPVALNGELGMVISIDGQREAAVSFEVGEDGLVHEVHIIVADDKLAALDRDVDMI